MDDTNVSVHSSEMKVLAYGATLMGKQFWKSFGEDARVLVLHFKVSNNTLNFFKF